MGDAEGLRILHSQSDLVSCKETHIKSHVQAVFDLHFIGKMDPLKINVLGPREL